MSNEIVKRDMDIETMSKASKFFAEGKMFIHAAEKRPLNQAEIFSIVEYGMELGIQPVIALQNIVPVKGRLCTSANIMLALAVQVGVKYKILSEEKDRCSIQFEREGMIYISTFDKSEAEQAGLLHKDNWKNYPKDMYRSRAIARGCRYIVPDKLAGLYLTEELTDVVTPSIDVIKPPENILHREEGLKPLHVMVDQENNKAAVVEEKLATERQVTKVRALINVTGINAFESLLKYHLFELDMIPIDKHFHKMTRVHISELINGLDPEKGCKMLIDFYAEEKYHEELIAIFKDIISKTKRVSILMSMAMMIEEILELPKKITDELTDQQMNDYFSLFLRAIHNEETNRRMIPKLQEELNTLKEGVEVNEIKQLFEVAEDDLSIYIPLEEEGGTPTSEDDFFGNT